MGRLFRSLRSCPVLTESFRQSQNFWVTSGDYLSSSSAPSNKMRKTVVPLRERKERLLCCTPAPKAAKSIPATSCNEAYERLHKRMSIPRIVLFGPIDLEDIIPTTYIRPYTIARRPVAAPRSRHACISAPAVSTSLTRGCCSQGEVRTRTRCLLQGG